jgi:lysophospholipase L1-like esterase
VGVVRVNAVVTKLPRTDPEIVRRRVFGGMYAFWGVVAGLVVLAMVAGCGSDAEPGGPARATTNSTTEAESGGTLVAALGDSITAGSPLWDPEPAIRAQLGPAADERSQYEYWAAREDSSLEFRNCGVPGERTDEIAQRLEQCATGADALIVQGGINDIAQGRPVTDAADDLRSMVIAGKGMGLRVAIADLLPWNNGGEAAAPAIAELNELIAAIAAEEDVPLLPFHATLADPADPERMRSEWTADGDHPSVEGYRLLGERAFELP